MTEKMDTIRDEQIAQLMDMVKDSLGQLAQAVHNAQMDGTITWWEALSLTTTATTTVLPIVSAFQQLSQASVQRLIEVLANSDIVFKEK